MNDVGLADDSMRDLLEKFTVRSRQPFEQLDIFVFNPQRIRVHMPSGFSLGVPQSY